MKQNIQVTLEKVNADFEMNSNHFLLAGDHILRGLMLLDFVAVFGDKRITSDFLPKQLKDMVTVHKTTVLDSILNNLFYDKPVSAFKIPSIDIGLEMELEDYKDAFSNDTPLITEKDGYVIEVLVTEDQDGSAIKENILDFMFFVAHKFVDFMLSEGLPYAKNDPIFKNNEEMYQKAVSEFMITNYVVEVDDKSKDVLINYWVQFFESLNVEK